MTYRPIDLRGAVLAVLVSVFWGANPVAVKVGLVDAPPLRLAAMRFVIGGVVIYVWAHLTRRLEGFRIAPDEWRPLMVLATLLTVQIGGMNIGTNLTTAAHAAVMINLYAVHTVVLAHFMIPGDRLAPGKLVGVLVAWGGILVLFGRELSAGAPTLLGDALIFLSAFLLGERTVYMAKAVQTLDPVKILLSQAVVGGALLAVLSAFLEPAPTTWTARLAGTLAYQGVVVAGFNFVVNLWLLKHYRPSALAALFLTQPVFGVVAAALMLGDRLSWELVVASVAVGIGIGLSSR